MKFLRRGCQALPLPCGDGWSDQVSLIRPPEGSPARALSGSNATRKVEMRPCPKCGSEKQHPSHSYCKPCASEYARFYRKHGRTHFPVAKSRKPNGARLPGREVRGVSEIQRKAHKVVENALLSGRLSRGKCWCGAEKVQAHHEDYYRPDEVVWLCALHHRRRHVELRKLPSVELISRGFTCKPVS